MTALKKQINKKESKKKINKKTSKKKIQKSKKKNVNNKEKLTEKKIIETPKEVNL